MFFVSGTKRVFTGGPPPVNPICSIPFYHRFFSKYMVAGYVLVVSYTDVTPLEVFILLVFREMDFFRAFSGLQLLRPPRACRFFGPLSLKPPMVSDILSSTPLLVPVSEPHFEPSLSSFSSIYSGPDLMTFPPDAKISLYSHLMFSFPRRLSFPANGCFPHRRNS